MLDFNVKIGLVPIRRDVTARPGAFNWERAEERCAKAVAYIKAELALPSEEFMMKKDSFI